MSNEIIQLTIDGKSVSVPKGTTVYEASRTLDIELPIFCYQDRMEPFGACRVCLVEVEKMGKLQASCTLAATEGMVVHTASKRAVQGREGILELLLINHPLDCPICDRGGECALQEFALEHGPGKSRFYEEKRQFPKAIPLGPVLTLDRERCITCARCTRFGELVAGDNALTFIDRGYRSEVGTADGEAAQSKFIGNTIMICPVGALTSEVYRFRARPWDNRTNETTCTLCPIGCSMKLDERDGEVQRTRSCTDPEVNDIWLCDKGWFGYEFAESEERLKHPLVRRNGDFRKISWEEAMDVAAEMIIEQTKERKIAAWGGNPLTTEESFLFQKLFRDGLSVPHLDHRIGMAQFSSEEEFLVSGMEISPGACEGLDYFYLLGCDITEEFPLLWLRLKQALNKGAKGYFIGSYTPEVASHLEETVLLAPLESFQEKIGKDLKGKGALFVGSQYLSSRNRSQVLKTCQEWVQTNPNLSLNLLEGRGNSRGAFFAGVRPDFGPCGTTVSQKGLSANEVLKEAVESGWGLIYCAGANPAAHYPSALFQKARAQTQYLIVQDLFMTETAKQADLVLPTLSFLEKRGTMINIEGRTRKIGRGKWIPEGLLSDSEIFKMLARKLDLPLHLDESFVSSLQGEKAMMAPHAGRALPQGKSTASLQAIFSRPLFDEGERMRRNKHLSKLVNIPQFRIHPETAISFALVNGKRAEIETLEGKISALVVFDSGVAKQTIVIPTGYQSLPTRELGVELYNGMAVSAKAVT